MRRLIEISVVEQYDFIENEIADRRLLENAPRITNYLYGPVKDKEQD